MVTVPRIAAVSYLNTIPFIYGIEHAGDLRAELLTFPPADCARAFREGRADVALVPAAAVPSLAGARIVTDYCIGASGPVRTVVLAGDTPPELAERVYLDPHSLTSVQLAGYLYAECWHRMPEYFVLDDCRRLDRPAPGDAFLLIGDKVFDREDRFVCSRDLAAEWIRATGLPFAFAVWVAREEVAPETTDALQRALTFGIEHTYEAIVAHGFDRKPYDAYDYLTRNIDFVFDIEKRRALRKFWDSGLKVSPRANPG